MKNRFKYFSFVFLLINAPGLLKAQCNFIPSTSSSVDTLSYIFSGGNFASYGCAPIDPTFWLSGNGIYAQATFVNPESYPSFRVWGMNDDDSAAVEVNGVGYSLDLISASYSPKVICGLSPGPDGVIFANGKLVGANSNAQGNYSYSDITINATNVTSIKVTGTNGAGWGFAGVSVDCSQLPVSAFMSAANSVCPGTCTDFSNLSTNATTFQWLFTGANPAISTDVNPTNICYNTPGNYPVTLIATNAGGSDTLTLNNYITVFPFPAPQGILQSGDTLIANTGAVSYQWYHAGILIPGATEYFYVISDGGNYNVVATDANGCEVEAAIFDVIAGTSSLIFGQWSISPSPVANILTIKNSEPVSMAGFEISVYDISGQKLVETLITNINKPDNLIADVTSLSPGIYILKINSAGKNSRIKFIKI